MSYTLSLLPHLLCDGIDPLKHLEPLIWLSVILVELLGHVRADVAKLLLDSLGCLQGLLRWDTRLSLSEELLDEVRNVSAGNRNVLDATTNDVAFSLSMINKRKGGNINI